MAEHSAVNRRVEGSRPSQSAVYYYGSIGKWLIRLTVYQEIVGSRPTRVVERTRIFEVVYICIVLFLFWGINSVGRVLHLQCKSHEFKSHMLQLRNEYALQGKFLYKFLFI